MLRAGSGVRAVGGSWMSAQKLSRWLVVCSVVMPVKAGPCSSPQARRVA